MKSNLFKIVILIAVAFGIFAPKIYAQNSELPENLHQTFDELLQKYVHGNRFDYEGIFNNKKDLQQLFDYVDLLEKQNTASWEKNDALAFWINLYNAATLELVLQNYPLKSIKDIGGLFSSPWKREVATVAGRKLNLDAIENDVIRKEFGDARIHFAVNCASIGCPPLANYAYSGKQLDAQLNENTKRALNDPNWVKITEDKLWVTKIFDWYKGDFEADAGSVRKFIAKFRPADQQIILDDSRKIETMDYNWNLNQFEKN